MTTDHRHTDPKHARRQDSDDDQPRTSGPNGPTGPADASTEPMREVSHTNPYTDESMGSLFEHGVTVVADGGERDAADEATATDPADATETASTDEETDEPVDDENEADAGTPSTQMKDVSHEAPEGGHGNRMFERVGDTADVPDESDEDE